MATEDWSNVTTNCGLNLLSTILLVLYGDRVVIGGCGGIETGVFGEAFAPLLMLAFEAIK